MSQKKDSQKNDDAIINQAMAIVLMLSIKGMEHFTPERRAIVEQARDIVNARRAR